MKFCPACQQCYEDDCARCIDDQTMLSPSRSGTRLVAHKYSLDRVLSNGGMETIYAGRHLETDRPVAIKLLLPQSVVDEDALKDFRREAHAVAHLNTRIDHQRVAKTYDYGLLPDGTVYMTMELVAGQTLREYMDKVKPVSIATAVRIARQVADGLDAAHRCGVVHGDLEPTNIILARDYYGRLEAKVVDFGFAKLRKQIFKGHGNGAHASAETPAGTSPAHYMSPEQRAGHNPDERADIYSLGMIIYEMLAGRLAFDARAATDTSLDQTEEEPPSLRESRGDVPEPLARLVKHALCKKSSARLHSAADFRQQLRVIEDSLTRGPLSSSVAPSADVATSNHEASRPLNSPRVLSDHGKSAPPPAALANGVVLAPSQYEPKAAGADILSAEASSILIEEDQQGIDQPAAPAAAIARTAGAATHAGTVTNPSLVSEPAAISRPARQHIAHASEPVPAKAASNFADTSPPRSPLQRLPVYAILIAIALALGIAGGLWLNMWSASSSPTSTPAASTQLPPDGVPPATEQAATAPETSAESQRAASDNPSLTAGDASPAAQPDEQSSAEAQRISSARTESDAVEEKREAGSETTNLSAGGERVSAAANAKADGSFDGTSKTEARAVAEGKQSAVGRCTLSISESSLTIHNDGGSDTITVSLNDPPDPAARVTATTPNWPDIVVFSEPQTSRDSGAIRYSVRSVSQRAGTYRVNFRSPCGSKTIPVTVRQP